uniref:Uncharacterized protein n=1 Tax=Timema douglasi TaxID=61478 RepID=A0A7R8ZAW8_TIMDO|nr:unnamed protein product [Timema douglasi]
MIPVSRVPARTATTHAPMQQQAPPASVPAMAAPQAQQPSMFKQMAATAGGVAVGSAVVSGESRRRDSPPVCRLSTLVTGHTLGHGLTSMFGGGGSNEAQPAAAPQSQDQGYGQQQQSQSNSGPCGFEIQQFLQCAQGQHDLTLCDGFNEALRQCKISNTTLNMVNPFPGVGVERLDLPGSFLAWMCFSAYRDLIDSAVPNISGRADFIGIARTDEVKKSCDWLRARCGAQFLFCTLFLFFRQISEGGWLTAERTSVNRYLREALSPIHTSATTTEQKKKKKNAMFCHNKIITEKRPVSSHRFSDSFGHRQGSARLFYRRQTDLDLVVGQIQNARSALAFYLVHIERFTVGPIGKVDIEFWRIPLGSGLRDAIVENEFILDLRFIALERFENGGTGRRPLCAVARLFRDRSADTRDRLAVRTVSYSCPMASLVLTDSSQLTVDSFIKLPDQIMYPNAELDDLQKHLLLALSGTAVTGTCGTISTLGVPGVVSPLSVRVCDVVHTVDMGTQLIIQYFHGTLNLGPGMMLLVDWLMVLVMLPFRGLVHTLVWSKSPLRDMLSISAETVNDDRQNVFTFLEGLCHAPNSFATCRTRTLEQLCSPTFVCIHIPDTHELTSSSFLSSLSFSLHTISWSLRRVSLVVNSSEFSRRSASFSVSLAYYESSALDHADTEVGNILVTFFDTDHNAKLPDTKYFAEE